MSLLNALVLGRDIAAAALGVSVALFAFMAFFGAGVFSIGVVASLATVAASSLATICAYALLGLFGEAPAAAALWIAAGVALALLIGGGQLYGVRGLWVSALLSVGIVAGAAFIWAFGVGRPGALGAVGPIAAFATIALMLTASLTATVRATQQVIAPLAASAPSQEAVDERPAPMAAALLATPPSWFDCAYGTFGGAALRQGFCTFSPPQVDRNPIWARTALTPPAPDEAMIAPPNPTLSADAAEPQGEAPTAAASPAQPSIETPDFDAIILGEEDDAPPPPGALASRSDAAWRRDVSATPDTPAELSATPEQSAEPSVMLESRAEAAPAQPEETFDDQTLRLVAAPSFPVERAGAEAPVGRTEPERSRTEFICFPLAGVLAEQLCPDQRLGVSDFEVSWRAPGGVALGALDRVECFYDPDQPLHAALLVDLSAHLLGEIDRDSAQATVARSRKSDALYDVLTRVIGSLRASRDVDDQGVYFSMSFANGDPLRGAWAAQDFGNGRRDRVFNLRSSGQTLALLNRLRGELQAIRPGGDPAPFPDALLKTIADAPTAPGEGGKPLVIALVDAAATAELDAATIETLRGELAKSGAPVFVIEIGAIGPSEAMARLVERTGGAAFGARDMTSLAKVIDRVLSRARSFCALSVTAPESFFRYNQLEVKLSRRMSDGCALEQVATLDCNGINLTQRIEPKGR